MFNDLLKIAIGFLFTGIIGSIISSKIQRKNFINQTKINKAEKEAEKIREIAKKIELLSGARNYSLRVLSLELLNKNNKLDEIRSEYRKTVKEWNINITTIYTELFSVNLYDYAIKLENSVHNTFRESHILILEQIENKSKNNSEKINILANKVFKNTRKISSELIEEEKKRWENTLSDNTEGLYLYNLERASSFILIKALFYKNPNSLRVKRPSLD